MTSGITGYTREFVQKELSPKIESHRQSDIYYPFNNEELPGFKNRIEAIQEEERRRLYPNYYPFPEQSDEYNRWYISLPPGERKINTSELVQEKTPLDDYIPSDDTESYQKDQPEEESHGVKIFLIIIYVFLIIGTIVMAALYFSYKEEWFLYIILGLLALLFILFIVLFYFSFKNSK